MRIGLCVAWLLLAVVSASGQRLVPGHWGLSVGAGPSLSLHLEKSPWDWSTSFAVSRYLRGYHYLEAEVSYTRQKYYQVSHPVPVEDWVLTLGYRRHLASTWTRVMLWYAGLHYAVGFEDVNRGLYESPGLGVLRSRSTWVMGCQLTTGLEFFLSDGWQLLVHLRGQLLFHSRLFPLRPGAQLGLRWNL